MPFDLMATKCDQCLMSLRKIVSDARRKALLKETARKDCAFNCHKGTMVGRDIACRGHFEATGGGQVARIAGRLGVIREIDPETLAPLPPADPR